MSNVIYMVKDKPLKEIIKKHLYEIYSKNEVDTFINATFDNMMSIMFNELAKSDTVNSVKCSMHKDTSMTMDLSKGDDKSLSLELNCYGIRSAKNVIIPDIKRIESDKIFTIDRDEFATEWKALIKTLFESTSLRERLKEMGSINSITVHGDGYISNPNTDEKKGGEIFEDCNLE